MNLAAINANAINASAFTVWQASADATVQVVATGNATKAALGRSSAPIIVQASAVGTVATKAQAGAVISLVGQATSANVQKSYGDALIELLGDATSHAVTSSYGAAQIIIGGQYALPEIQPTTNAHAPVSRRIMAEGDIRIIKVSEDLPLLVEEQRGAAIQFEDRQA